MVKLAIVSPCYNEEQVLDETTKRLVELLEQMISDNQICRESKIIYVNDGSLDNTWNLISQYHKGSTFVSGINLAGNVGHQNALLAGLSVAKDYVDAIISIDADLQDDITVIPQMVDYFSKGYDIVYGVRKERNTDTWFKRNTAIAFYKLMRFLGVKSVYNHADFRLMSKRSVEQLIKYRERNLFLRGIVPLIGYKTINVYYNRSERLAGESKYPLKKMVNFAIDGITSFSVQPVRMVLLLGLLFLVISIFIFIYVLYSYFSGHIVSGWASIMLSIWLVGGCVLIGLGIVGEYIGKIYIEVKNRPRYNIQDVLM